MKDFRTAPGSLRERLQVFLHPVVLKALLVINILGSIYGYYWYREQLHNTPLEYWIFTPDSPLATTLFALTIFFMLGKQRVFFLFFLSFVALIKYGLWAVFVNTHYWIIAGEIHGVEVMLWLSHLGMAAEGIIYLLLCPPSFWEWATVSLWLIFNDYVDYVWDLHPYLYLESQTATVEGFTYFLTSFIILSVGLYFYIYRHCASCAAK